MSVPSAARSSVAPTVTAAAFASEQSALTTFLYLLMRDHVPTGKVREALDHALASHPPSRFSAPELEALAKRYAGEIEAGPTPEDKRSPVEIKSSDLLITDLIGGGVGVQHKPSGLVAQSDQKRRSEGIKECVDVIKAEIEDQGRKAL